MLEYSREAQGEVTLESCPEDGRVPWGLHGIPSVSSRACCCGMEQSCRCKDENSWCKKCLLCISPCPQDPPPHTIIAKYCMNGTAADTTD